MSKVPLANEQNTVKSETNKAKGTCTEVEGSEQLA